MFYLNENLALDIHFIFACLLHVTTIFTFIPVEMLIYLKQSDLMASTDEDPYYD